MIVRQLTSGDTAAYRALHRFGMSESPTGFVDVAATDAARPDSQVREMLQRGDGWGAFDGARRVALWVNGVNAHARSLYERMGFRQTGRIPGGIQVGDAYVDDVLMTLELV